jgi:predicted amidophosphoribosyltransferase
VRALKRKEHPAFWREAAIWALEAFPAPPPGSVIVPIPSSGRGKNHALGFARALSSWSGLEVRELLRSRPGLPQKGLSRRARRFRRFEPTVPAWNICTPVVIVDDVVTTGATLNAAWEALGRPGACQAWCLMDRRPT